MIACAVEDDAIWVTDVDFANDAGSWQVVKASEPSLFFEREFDPLSLNDDQHTIDMEGLINRLAGMINGLPRPVHVVGFSTFGNVHIETGNILFRPMERERNLIPTCFPRRIEDLTAIPKDRVIVANDATAAAIGEWKFGFGKDTTEFAYVWAGRGVNVGLVLNGLPWRGRLHPEAGHILVRRHENDLEQAGVCPDHDGCVLGLTCLRAINRRLSHIDIAGASDLLGYYYAQLCLDVSLTVAPERIALGGLLMERYALPELLENTRRHFREIKGEYPTYVRQEAADFIGAGSTPCASLWGLVEMGRQRLNGHLK
jgi:fructokinase